MVVNQSVVPGRPLPPPSRITSKLDAFARRFCHETDHASYATNATGGARTLELSRQLLDEFNDSNGVTLAKYHLHAISIPTGILTDYESPTYVLRTGMLR